MSNFSVAVYDEVSDREVLSLYDDAGWRAYTKDPETLMRGINNSTMVITARDTDGTLVGLARVMSDDATICYVQDILVRRDAQRAGIGRALLTQISSTYRHVRQLVLLTDNEPGQRAFYESLGFTEGADFVPEPLRVFVLVR